MILPILNVLENENIQKFYKKQEDTFDILTFDFSQAEHIDNLDWTSLIRKKKEIVPLLKKHQRLLRLYPEAVVDSDMDINGEALETHAAVAIELLNNFNSAHEIANLSEQALMKLCPTLNPAVANTIHKRAIDIRERTALLSANLRDVVASPHYRGSRFCNLEEDLIEFAEENSELELITIDTSEATLENRLSKFSPEKYFVDLKNTIETQITKPTENKQKLSSRRPDLFTDRVPFDYHHSNTEIPYLQHVIEILEARLDKIPKIAETDVDFYLANKAKFPFNLPFHRPLSQIRAYLQHFKLDLATIMEQFPLGENDKWKIAREQLSLSAEEYILIKGVEGEETEDNLKAFYGIDDLTKLNKVSTFLNQTDITRSELQELFYQNLSREEQESSGLFRRFFINRDVDGTFYLSIKTEGTGHNQYEVIEHLNNKTLDRLHRFIRLARKLQWSFTDLDWMLNAIQATSKEISEKTINKLAQIKQLQLRFNLPLEELATFWYDIKTYGRVDDHEPQALFDKVFNTPMVFDTAVTTPYRPKYEGNPIFKDKLLTWNPNERTGKNAQYRQRLIAALGINDADLFRLTEHLFEKDPTNLCIPNLSSLYRVVKLAACLNLPIDKFLLLVNLLKDEKILTEPFKLKGIIALTKWADWLKITGLSVYQLQYLTEEKISPYVHPNYTVDDAKQMIKRLQEIPKLNFITDGIDKDLSEKILRQLKVKQFVDEHGWVIKDYSEITFDALKIALKGILPATKVSILDFYSTDNNKFLVDCGKSDHFNLTEAVTIEAWIKAPEKVDGMIAHKGGIWGKKGYGMYWVLTDGKQVHTHLMAENEKSGALVRVHYKEIKDKWTHLAFTWSKKEGVLKLYFNGKEKGKKYFKDFLGVNEDLPFTIGGSRRELVTYFKGHIAEVRLWNYARSQEEIVFNKNNHLREATPGLMGYWRMTEGEGKEEVIDFSGFKNNGIIKVVSGSTIKWKELSDFPIDNRISFIRDILLQHKTSSKLIPHLVLTELTEFFSVKEDLMEAAIAFTNKATETPNHIFLLLYGNETGKLAWIAKLAHKLYVSKTFNLSAEALQGIHDKYKVAFGLPVLINKEFKFTIKQLEVLQFFRKLSNSFRKIEDGLIGVFAQESKEKQLEQLAEISGWHLEELTSAFSTLYANQKGLTVSIIQHLSAVFDTAQSMGIHFEALHQLSTLHGDSANKDNWYAYKKGATTLLEILNSKYEGAEWDKIIAPINSHLNEATRNSMANYCGYRLNFENRLEGLYEHLLIDVEMSGCARISRLKQGLNALQIYVHRCRSGLEPGVVNHISEDLWKIIGEYRVWEAHGKLKAYPENYIDPGLRKLKTPIYEDIQTEILQGELNDEAAETAYRNYFEKFTEEANLEPVDALYATITNPETGESKKILFVISRARQAPHSFYIRQAQVGVKTDNEVSITGWTPWEKLEMGASIQAETVTPVFAFGKLFLFWVQQSEITKTRMVSNESKQTTGTFAHIQYIYQDVRGMWSAPQTLEKDILFHIKSEDTETEIEKLFPAFKGNHWMKPEENGFKVTDECWQKVYPLHLSGHLDEGRIFLLYGKPKIDNSNAIFNAGGIMPFVLRADLTFLREHVTLSNASPSLSKDAPVLSSRRIYTKSDNALEIAEPKNHLLDNWVDSKNDSDKIAAKSIHSKSKTIPVKNVLGWALFDNDDEVFITFLEKHQPIELSKEIVYSDNNELKCKKGTWKTGTKFSFVRLSTDIVHPLTERLHDGGLKHLLTLESQRLSELDFSRIGPVSTYVKFPTEHQLDFCGPYGAYYWEIFFNIPFLFAKSLYEKKRYEASRKWYNFIFDPYTKTETKHEWNDFQNELHKLRYFWSFDGSGYERVKKGTLPLRAEFPMVSNFPNVGNRQVIHLSKKRDTVALGNLFNYHLQEFQKHFTIEFWLKVGKEQTGEWNILTNKSANTSPEEEFIIGIKENKFFFKVRKDILNSKVEIEKETWYHCAFVYNYQIGIANLQFYIDGEAESFSQIIKLPEEYYYLIGGHVDEAVDFQVADLSVWSRALYPEEIKEQFKPAHHKYWRFLPLVNLNTKTLKKRLNNEVYLSAYKQYPYDAEALACLRPIPLQKAIIMRYIDNLLDWGDELFGKDSWETNLQATILYIMTKDILNKRPKYLSPSSAGNMIAASSQKQLAVNQLVNLEQEVQPMPDTCMLTTRSFNTNDPNFFIPENEELVKYWDLVADRLFKLRHCMNIEGVVRQLASYRAPIDPRKIAEQLAASQNHKKLASSPTITRTKFPGYMKRAFRATQQVMQLGQSLLKAFESMDAADMDSLIRNHEKQLLGITTAIKNKEIEEQKAIIESLDFGKKRAEAELVYYNLILEGGDAKSLGKSLDEETISKLNEVKNFNNWANQLDENSIYFSTFSFGLRSASLIPKVVATASHWVPVVWGTANGGLSPGSSFDSAADLFSITADMLDTLSSISAYRADRHRGKVEQLAHAAFCKLDLEQIKKESNAANNRLEIIEKEKGIHEKSIKHWKAKEDLAKGQFTGPELYRWMVQRISTVYLQAFKVAYDLAKAAEKTYHTERNTNQTFIKDTHWDSVQKGLLAAEGLLVDLEQLDKAYLDSEPMSVLHLNKTCDLSSLAPAALAELKKEGRCTFQLTESLFDHDFPGHYNRKIKSVALSVKGSFDGADMVRASLKQLNNRVIPQPDLEAAKFLLLEPGAMQPAPSNLLTDYIAGQQISVTHCKKDCGLFELKFDDEKYLPFEGTGAISTWELRMPKAANRFCFEELKEVTLHLQYTALDGGMECARELIQTQELKYHADHRNVSIREEFPGIWEQFLTADQNGQHQLKLNISEKFFNINLKPNTFQLGKEEDGERNIFLTPIFNSSIEKSVTENLHLTVNGETWNKKVRKVKVEDSSDKKDNVNSGNYPIHLTLSKPADQLLAQAEKVSKIDSEQLLDILMILPYEGELDWSGLVD